MLVINHGLAHETHTVSSLVELVGQVRVLVVHEQVGSYAADFLPSVGANRARSPTDAKDLGRGIELGCEAQPVAVLPVARAVHDVPRRIDQDRAQTGPGLVVTEPHPARGTVSAQGYGLAVARLAVASGQEDEGGRRPHHWVAERSQERVQKTLADRRVVVE